MNCKILKIAFFLFLTFLFSFQSFAQNSSQNTESNPEDRVEVTADQLEYLRGEAKVIARGNVVVIYRNSRLVADYAEVYTEDKKAFATGHVILFRGGSQLKGEQVEYDFATDQGKFPKGRTVNPPFYTISDNLVQESKDKGNVENGFLTTCNLFKPHYGVSAEKMDIYFDDKVVAKNCYFHVLGKKVFWWPYFIMPLDWENAPAEIEAGYSSDWGAYTLISKGFSLNKNIRGKWHADWRSKRGFGGGADFDYEFKDMGEGELKLYITGDKDAPNKSIADPESVEMDQNRWRISWNHRINIDEYSHIVAEYNRLYDPFVLKDFFEEEYRREVDPETYVTYTRNGDRYGFLINVEKRVNNFVSTTERLPEIRFNWNNRRLPNLPIYFKNETSFINFNQKFAGTARDNDVIRTDFFNEFSYPFRMFNYSFRPFVNFRENYYSKNMFGKDHIFNHQVGLGADVNSRYHRIYDINGEVMGIEINQLRHIIEPSVLWDSNRFISTSKSNLFQIDEIDAEEEDDEFKFGVRNRLQTKREINGEMRRVDLFSLENFATFEAHAEPDSWLFFDTEMDFRPFNWLILHHENRFDLERDIFAEAKTDVEFRGGDRWHLYLSHNFIGESKVPGGADDATSLVTLDGLYTINDLWKVGGYLRNDFDNNLLEETQIRFIRDMHCWLFEFGFNRTNEKVGEGVDIEAFFRLILKAFPEYVLSSGGRATYSRSRFGTLYGGSNDPTLQSETESYGY